MKNLSQNVFNQITEMHGQSQDELKWNAKIKRIKNYEEMSKEELMLIIPLLKSKQSLAKLFNNNINDNKINDIRKFIWFDEAGEEDYYKPILVKSSFNPYCSSVSLNWQSLFYCNTLFLLIISWLNW